MKTWDVVIIGGGIVGVSLARDLCKHGARILIVERGEPGREASYAAAGMLADCDLTLPSALQPLAALSAAMYPEFVHEIEDESGMHVDLRLQGTISLSAGAVAEPNPPCMRILREDEMRALEPAIANTGHHPYFLREGSVDPRALITASLKAAKHRGIEVASGAAVQELQVQEGRAVAVRTAKTRFAGDTFVNCCGAWAGQLAPLPTRPVKGQMLCVIPARQGLLQHVVRAPEVYIVPRSDGRTLIGSTLEDVGFDKRVVPDTVQRLHQAAANLVPELGQAKMLETWAGLRPGTPDHLPLLGAAAAPNCFVAAGHYRDGILLAPVTAHLMSQMVRGLKPDVDLSAFSPARF